jgi:hypothetical protein
MQKSKLDKNSDKYRRKRRKSQSDFFRHDVSVIRQGARCAAASADVGGG